MATGDEVILSQIEKQVRKLNAFMNLLDGYEILELARTVITGLSRGSKDVTLFL